jgi:rhodanese-related sulfurtransferase
MIRQAASLVILLSILVTPAYGTDEGRYCGLYCIYGAARALGLEDVQFSDLLSEEFVSSPKGSTAEDLIAAGKSIDVRVTKWQHGTLASLLAAREPLILHVASGLQFKDYNHWALFLGWDGDLVRLADQDGNVVHELPSVLLAKWDGTALLVSRPDQNSGMWVLYAAEIGVVFLVALLIFFALRALLVVRPGVESIPWFRPISLIGIAATAVLVVVWLTPVTSDVSRHRIQRAFETRIQKTVSLSQLTQLSKAGAILVDARYERDFGMGHIPGAINMPVDSLDKEFVNLRKTMPADQTIIVYCQSANCAFDASVAERLHVAGFTNVHELSEGYLEWRSTTGGSQ